jgi:hypothetical protein
VKFGKIEILELERTNSLVVLLLELDHVSAVSSNGSWASCQRLNECKHSSHALHSSEAASCLLYFLIGEDVFGIETCV